MLIDYKSEDYMRFDKLRKIQVKYNYLFIIRDALLNADAADLEKVSISFPSSKDDKEVLAIAGSLHFWWVIDYVLNSEDKITLLYRNCRKHHEYKKPEELWAELIPTVASLPKIS